MLPRLVIFSVALALLLAVAAPAHAADRDAPPELPAWQLPMLAGAGGLALGLLVGRGGSGVRSRGPGMGQRGPTPDSRFPRPGHGIDGPTERRARPGAAPDQPGYRLVAWAGERRIVHELRGRQCVIGRDPGCDMPLDDPRIAALHARVTLAGGRVTLTDLGSATGSSLTPGGPPLTPHQPIDICDGDEFWLGAGVQVVLRQAAGE